jgi:hypothetical protein
MVFRKRLSVGNLSARLQRQDWPLKLRVVLVLLPKNQRKNNIFQRFIIPKTKIKLNRKTSEKRLYNADHMFLKRICHPVVQSNLFGLLLYFNIVFPFTSPLSEVLGMVHKRSFYKLQRRIIRNIIFKNAYIDKYRGKIVSRISRLDVLDLLTMKLQCLPYSRH